MDGENDKLKIVEFKPKQKDKPAIDSGLILFLEQTLEEAKRGEILLFSCTAMYTKANENLFIRYYRKCAQLRWIECLGFTELMQKEVHRVRGFVEQLFESDED